MEPELLSVVSRQANSNKFEVFHGRDHRRQYQDGRAQCRRPEGDIPGPRGNDRAVRGRHRQALCVDRDVHLRPGLHLDGKLRVEDHLHRRRRRSAVLPRLPDRADRRARRLPGDVLSAALRRAADVVAEGRFRLPGDPPHDGPRADEPVLPGLPPRRPSDGRHGRQRRRAFGLLSRLDRHLRPDPADDRVDADDRQDADARRHGLQIFDRPAVHLSEERSGLLIQLPAHVLRGSMRGVPGQPGHGAGGRSHLHPARRPRAERFDLDGAAGRLVGGQSVRLHRRRHCLPVGVRRMAVPTRRR